MHIQTSEEAVNDLLKIIRELAEEKKAAGFVREVAKEGNGGYRDVYVRVTKAT
jgi:threonine aldolase